MSHFEISCIEGICRGLRYVDLGKGEWILVESTAGTGTIDRIHTNAKRFHTQSGYYVGQKLADILRNAKNVGLDIDEGFMSIRLYDEKVSFSLDEKSEDLFYKRDGSTVKDIRPQATIAEIAIF